MTDICDPAIRRLLRALSQLCGSLSARRRSRGIRRTLRLHRMNDHMLRDIGFTRADHESSQAESLQSLILPFERRDDQDM